MRIDKWLWITRLYKTRKLAKLAISRNDIQCNGLKVKPSKVLGLMVKSVMVFFINSTNN